MGVPAFFRWLSRKYPSVIIECIEERQYNTDDGKPIPQDTSQPNPNDVEFDNLYLDMNGIIHPCTHPEDRPAPKNEDEMMAAIFECIDRLFAIVRPRKLLYMAIDGVAPRAKMNQQRSRRFRASKEAAEKKAEVARIRQELQDKGFRVPAEKPKEAHFDSNCITPGTPFMDRLSKCLHYYVHDRLNTDAGWRDIKVILSDANVPGEGEHKIMDFIRKQRAQPDHDPNTQHVLCGADADLIMLGLATHEVNFTIIREEFKPNKPKPCDICGQIGHELDECVGVSEGGEGEPEKVFEETRYIFVRLNVLREYLERELQMQDVSFKYDFDRAVDDWVFMCFFVGNDFLPHLPSLEIRENAIDRLINLYKDCCRRTGGWLTDSGTANMNRVQMILQNLGKVEDVIFVTRQRRELEFRARDKAKRKSEKLEKEAANRFKNETGKGALGVMKAGETAVAHGAKGAIMEQRYMNMSKESGRQGRGQKRPIDSVDGSDDEEEETPDEVRLFEPGFKDRYYESKFEVNPNNLEFRKHVADEYARGLCWVLKYYYQGCVSWDWYFPYHYAPFASDFTSCANANVKFNLGTPFNPLEQLMGVFPAGSRSHVPEPWGELMIDPESVIIDFYPEDFKIDLNGKKFAWQGVALLPFVDEKRLKNALDDVYDQLTPEEVRRNQRGDDRLYVSVKHLAYTSLSDLYRMGMDKQNEVPISGKEFQHMQGLVLLAKDCVETNGVLETPVQGMEDIKNNQVITVRFRNPKYATDFVFPARKLKKAKDPPRVLKPSDLSEERSRNYRPVIGFNRNMPRAHLGGSGHRALGHYTNQGGGRGQGRGQSGQYSIVPPPPDMRDSHRRHSGGGGGGVGSGGGGRSLLGEPPSFNFPLMSQSSSYNSSSRTNQYSGGGGGYTQNYNSRGNFGDRRSQGGYSSDYNSVLETPVQGMEDIKNNQVNTVMFRNPKYATDFVFPARKLKKAEDPPRVLKPSDLGEERSRNYRPVIGFNSNMPRAHLEGSGHRALGHFLPNLQGGELSSHNVPPLKSARGGQGLLGASPDLLPTPPRPGRFMGPGLGDEGPIMGSGMTGQGPPLRPGSGERGLLGSGPEMQGFPEDFGNAPGHYTNQGGGRGQGRGQSGQYSIVPPPPDMRDSHRRHSDGGGGVGSGGGGRSLLGEPPSFNFPLMSQSSSYNSSLRTNQYSGGGGGDTQNYNSRGNLDDRRSQGGYSSDYNRNSNYSSSSGGYGYSTGSSSQYSDNYSYNSSGNSNSYSRNSNQGYGSNWRGQGGVSGSGGSGGYYTSRK